MFPKLPTANRGEIAWRIIRAAGKSSPATRAAYSEDDRTRPHLAQADGSTLCL